jgi:hypothetical protein
MEQAATAVRKEKAERTFPTAYRAGPDYDDLLGDSLCDCPDCRRARGEGSGPFADLDDFDLEEALEDMPLPPGMTPEMGKMLLQEAMKAVERGEPIDAMLHRVFGPETGFGGKRKKGGRR